MIEPGGAPAQHRGSKERFGAGGRRGALAGIVAIALVTWISTGEAWLALEERAQAVAIQRAGSRPWNPRVVLVLIDDESMLRLGRPVPRAVYARVVDALAAAGVRAIAFDLFLPDGYDPEGTVALAESARRFGRVVMPAECLEEIRPKWNPGPLPAFASASIVNVRSFDPPKGCSAFDLPSGLLGGAVVLAHVQNLTGKSGYARSLKVVASDRTNRFVNLAVATYATAHGIRLPELREEPGALLVGDLRIPVHDGEAILATYRDATNPAVSPKSVRLSDLADAVRGDPPRLLDELVPDYRDTIVMLGLWAKTSGDHGHIISGEQRPLVLLQTSLLQDMIERRFLAEVPQAVQLGVVVAAGLVMLLAALVLRPGLAAFALAMTLLGLAGATVRLADGDMLLRPLAPGVSAVAGCLTMLVSRLASREREQRVLSDAFGAYVDPQVLRRILDDPAHYLALGGARRRLSVLFADIVGFTQLSNALPAEEVIGLLREYLEEITALVTAREGRVDKIMGDGILAVFGDPIPCEDHALRAVEVGLSMQARVQALRQRLADAGRATIAIRVGIATGDVFVGNIGSRRAKLEYTVIGATVNLASRLEGKAPPGGVLVSRETREDCGERFQFEDTRGLELKGFSGPVEAYLARPRSEGSGAGG